MADTPVPDVEGVQHSQARFDELWRWVGMVLGPGRFVLLLLLPLESLTPEGRWLAAVMALVIVVFWITEVLPLEMTALLGPMLAIMSCSRSDRHARSWPRSRTP